MMILMELAFSLGKIQHGIVLAYSCNSFGGLEFLRCHAIFAGTLEHFHRRQGLGVTLTRKSSFSERISSGEEYLGCVTATQPSM